MGASPIRTVIDWRDRLRRRRMERRFARPGGQTATVLAALGMVALAAMAFLAALYADKIVPLIELYFRPNAGVS